MNSEQASRPETNGHDMQPNSDKKQSMDSSSELLKHESLDQGQKNSLLGHRTALQNQSNHLVNTRNPTLGIYVTSYL